MRVVSFFFLLHIFHLMTTLAVATDKNLDLFFITLQALQGCRDKSKIKNNFALELTYLVPRNILLVFICLLLFTFRAVVIDHNS